MPSIGRPAAAVFATFYGRLRHDSVTSGSEFGRECRGFASDRPDSPPRIIFSGR